MKILNLGSLNIDLVYKVKEFVKAKETISSYSMEKFCGGKGLNQSTALARAGVEVYHGGKIGDDGIFLKNTLEKAGVNVENIIVGDVPTGNAIIQIDESGQNCILLFGGANMSISKDEIHSILSNFNEGDWILLQNEVSNLDYIVDKASEKGMVIVLNPSPMNEKILSLPLEKINWFVLNEVEGMAITNTKKIDKVLGNMVKMFPQSNILLTLGENGSQLYVDGIIYNQSIFKVNAVDTTAAGDTFTGYFISSIMSGKSYQEALKISAKASSICVETMGASNSIPKLVDVLSEL